MIYTHFSMHTNLIDIYIYILNTIICIYMYNEINQQLNLKLRGIFCKQTRLSKLY